MASDSTKHPGDVAELQRRPPFPKRRYQTRIPRHSKRGHKLSWRPISTYRRGLGGELEVFSIFSRQALCRGRNFGAHIKLPLEEGLLPPCSIQSCFEASSRPPRFRTRLCELKSSQILDPALGAATFQESSGRAQSLIQPLLALETTVASNFDPCSLKFPLLDTVRPMALHLPHARPGLAKVCLCPRCWGRSLWLGEQEPSFEIREQKQIP